MEDLLKTYGIQLHEQYSKAERSRTGVRIARAPRGEDLIVFAGGENVGALEANGNGTFDVFDSADEKLGTVSNPAEGALHLATLDAAS
jgi:hypothetical protein